MEGVGMIVDSPLVRSNLSYNSVGVGYNNVGNTWNIEGLTTAGRQSQITCPQYINNISMFLNTFNAEPDRVNKTSEDHLHDGINHVITDIAVPIMCVFGILGNMLNLVVLTRKQLKCTMDCLEKSAHLGLVALAVSDALFCILYLPTSMVSNEKLVYTHHDNPLTLYYNIYYEPMTNVFLLSSTWLTVIMALARYIAICHPFRARGFINLAGTRAAICCVYVASVLLNLPRFWHYYSKRMSCDEVQPMTDIPLPPGGCDCYYYMKAGGNLYKNKTFEMGYSVGYFIVGLIIPLIMLTFCNICLIRALRQSYQMQRMYRANTPRDSGHRITPTLITIIILFTLLVTPSEILAFFKRYITTHRHDYVVFNTANIVTNFTLVTNFSINFVLYCVINVNFRKTVKDILTCSCSKKKTHSPEYTKANHFTTTINISECETEM